MAIQGNILIIASGTHTPDDPPIGDNISGSLREFLDNSYAFTDGTLPTQADLLWSSRAQLPIGGTQTITLTGGGLTDVFGNAVNFANVTAICVSNRETVAGTRIIAFRPSAGPNPFQWTFGGMAHLVQVPPGGSYLQWDDNGRAVAAGNCNLDLTNLDGANAANFDIWILGRSV